MLANVTVAQRDGRHDFDFFAGSWTVHHRRLKRPLTGSQDWYDFHGTTVTRVMWGGLSNIDDNVLDSPLGSFHAISIRFYDMQTRQWSIYWATDKNGLTPVPTVGSFVDGVGTFYNRETFEDKPIVSRFIWSHVTASSCRWEQAFSPDDGQTWETNWIMEFTRMTEALEP